MAEKLNPATGRPIGFDRWDCDRKVAWLNSPEGLEYRAYQTATQMHVSLDRARSIVASHGGGSR